MAQSNITGRRIFDPTVRVPQLPRLDKYRLEQWDKGVFSRELLHLAITPGPPSKRAKTAPDGDEEDISKPGFVHDGTFVGSQMAVTEIVNMSETT